jgi:hypothetical protein
MDLRGLKEVGLDEVNGKDLNRVCVKVLNKDKLKNRKKHSLEDKTGP